MTLCFKLGNGSVNLLVIIMENTKNKHKKVEISAKSKSDSINNFRSNPRIRYFLKSQNLE